MLNNADIREKYSHVSSTDYAYMTPAAKFNSFLASTTVFLMFWLVAHFAPMLKEAGGQYSLLGSIGALLASAGAYRILALAVRWLMERSEWVRRVALGPYDMHGTWIGWFRGHNGELRLMVEHFVQDIDGLVISGRSYFADGKDHGLWSSTAVMLDVRRGQLVFTYSFDGNSRSATLMGINNSLLERASALSAPTGYSGLAHDLNDRVRISVTAKKQCSELLPWREALQLAVTEYKDV